MSERPQMPGKYAMAIVDGPPRLIGDRFKFFEEFGGHPALCYWTTHNGGGWVWNGLAGNVIHWMPLPIPPAGGQDD